MLQRLLEFGVRHPWLNIFLFTAVTLGFASQLPKTRFDTELANQLPSGLGAQANLGKIEERFGGTDMVMLVMSGEILKPTALRRLRQLSEAMALNPGIERVFSLFTAKHVEASDSELSVEPLVPEAPGPGDGARLARRIAKNPLVYGSLVSKNFEHAAVLGFVKPKTSDEALVQSLRALIAKNPGPEPVLLGGLPATRVQLGHDMRRDLGWFLPVGLGLMLAFLVACFRQARAALLPFVVTVMAIIVAQGLIPVLGWKVHTVTILLPVILLAVSNDYGIHLLARYQVDAAQNPAAPSRELALGGLKALSVPVLGAAITTMAGLLCLESHIVIPAKELGVLAAAGVGFALLASLVFIPAVLAVLPKPRPLGALAPHAPQPRLGRVLIVLVRGVMRRPRRFFAVFVLATAAIGSFAFRIVVDTNPLSFYSEKDPVWRATELLNRELGGAQGLAVVFEGDVKDPRLLSEIDELERYLQKHPLVGSTVSIAGVLRELNQVMHSGDPKFYRIPETRELVAEYLLLYSMSSDPDDLAKLVDFEYAHAELMVKITDSGTRAATRLVADIDRYVHEHKLERVERVGGLTDVMAELVHHVVVGQLTSLVFALVLVWLLVALTLRSWLVALLAMLPPLLSVVMVFGVMGMVGIKLDLVTALLSCIMIGVGVDYSIHFLCRYRDDRRSGLSAVDALERTLLTSGRGIVFNALSVVVGFSVLVLSAFLPVRFFGWLVLLSIMTSLGAALVVLPALTLWVRPKALEP